MMIFFTLTLTLISDLHVLLDIDKMAAVRWNKNKREQEFIQIKQVLVSSDMKWKFFIF